MVYARMLVVGLSLVVLGSCGENSQVSKSPLEGAWLVVDVRFGSGGEDIGAMSAQPGQFVFTQNRYAAVWVTQTEPRALSVNPWEPTRDEMVTHYQSVAANSGTYEVSGSRITIRPIVAKNPNFPGGQLTYEFRIEGDMLFLEAVDEGHLMASFPPNTMLFERGSSSVAWSEVECVDCAGLARSNGIPNIGSLVVKAA